MGNMETFPDASVQILVLFITARGHAVERRGSLRIERGEQRHINPAAYQPIGEQAGHLFPRAVMLGWSAPRDRPEKRDFHLRPGDAALQPGALQREQRLQIGQGGFRTLVGVQTLRPESVMTAAGGEVVDRKALVVPPQE